MMNTTVACTTLYDADAHRCTRVHPDEADYMRGRLSVLPPVGIAILVSRCGQTVVCRPQRGVAIHHVNSAILLQTGSRPVTGRSKPDSDAAPRD